MPTASTDAQALQAEILRLDPSGAIVKIDVQKKTVEYSDEILVHEAVSPYASNEEPVRALLVVHLCTEAGYLPANIELEKRYSIGRAGGSKAEGDILIRRPDGTTYALVEAKTFEEYDKGTAARDAYIEGQLFSLAPHEEDCEVLALATAVVGPQGDVAIRSTVIDYHTHTSYERWIDAGRSKTAAVPISYGESRHEHRISESDYDLRSDVSSAELSRIRKRLHDVLWGGSQDDNVVYDYVVKLLLAKIHDEKTTEANQRYKFQRWHEGNRPESVEATFERISNLYVEAYARFIAPSDDEAGRPFDERVFSPSQIAFVVEQLEDISIASSRAISGDVLGDFFEAITRQGFKQSKGLFFTHTNIAEFVVAALELPGLARELMLQPAARPEDRLPYVIDPSCGSGNFLMASMRSVTHHILKNSKDIGRTKDNKEMLKRFFPKGNENLWAADFIYGIEKSQSLAMSTKVNMILHGDGNTHIYCADGLSPLQELDDPRFSVSKKLSNDAYQFPQAGHFDAVVSNPPFSITLDQQTSTAAERIFQLAPTRNPENLFLERWYQLLKPGGRLGAVMPESFFATKENLSARLFLFDHFDVRAVVSLPRLAFEPWTPTKTSLLFAQRKSIEDERSWIQERQRKAATADAVYRAVKNAIKRLRSQMDDFGDAPSTSLAEVLTPQQLGQLRGADSALSLPQVDFDSPISSTALSKYAQELESWMKNFSSEAWSLRVTAAGKGGSFAVVHADDIGYKRTKRGEQVRRCDLFKAVDSNGNLILNLSDAGGDWRFDLNLGEPADVLSYLSSLNLWSGV